MAYLVADISLALDRPWWLLMLVVAIVPVLAARVARRKGRPLGAAVTVLRLAVVVLVAVALSRPVLFGVGRSARGWLVLEDASASVSGQESVAVEPQRGVDVEVLQFAAGLAERGQPLDVTATNLAPALRLAEARARAKKLGGLVVITDGQFTDADWSAAAETMRRNGLSVLIVPMASPPADARASDLSARRGANGEVSLAVTVVASKAQTRTLTVARTSPDRAELLRRHVHVLPGAPATFRVTDRALADNAVEYTATLDKADTFAENDCASIFVVPQRQRAAVVAGRPVEAVLARLAADRPEYVSAVDAPEASFGWSSFACVVLVDAEGTLLSAAQRTALADYVRSGGGLVVVGSGPRATPGDADDPLNQVAALVANPFERRPLAMTVVLDASGSMGQADETAPGLSRFDLAAQATTALQRHLTDKDTLVVVTFSDVPQGVYDSGDGPPDFDELTRALHGVKPSGPTKLWPALQQATAGTPPVGRQRLILLVSDMQTELFDVEAARRAVTSADAALAVVAVGSPQGMDRASLPLPELAVSLDAPLVEQDSLLGVAEVFGRFIRQRRGSAVREGDFAVAASEAMGLPAGRLSAYILAAPADETVSVFGRIEGDPVLAGRRVGLGRSATLAVPLTPGADDSGDGGRTTAALAAAMVRWAQRSVGDPRLAGTVQRRDGVVTVHIDAADERGPVNDLSLKLLWIGGGGELAGSANMQQVAPGRYEAVTEGADGPLWLTVVGQDGDDLWHGAATMTAGAEFHSIGANWDSLRRLELLTGGRIVPVSESLALGDTIRSAAQIALWPMMLAAAVAAVLAQWVWPSRWSRQ
ncbi:MAG: VWA domain-containing protein [Planctomycetota bacterium]|jgi:hypothetical protein